MVRNDQNIENSKKAASRRSAIADWLEVEIAHEIARGGLHASIFKISKSVPNLAL